MFWYLLLAHFLSDYPFQPDWMVRNKPRFWVLFLHVTIHFIVGMAILLPFSALAWPYLLLLAAIHFIIDAAKNWINLKRPRWVAGPYVVDQALHYLSIGFISVLAGRALPLPGFAIPRNDIIFALGFLLVTYVWLITERVFKKELALSQMKTESGAWPRLFFRAAMLAGVLTGAVLIAPLAAGMVIRFPYQATRDGYRALLTDILVTLAHAALVVLVNTGRL